MTIRDITALRLVSQGIASASGKLTPVIAVVRHMGAMQAQDYYGSLWAIGLRTNRTEKEVIQAIEAYEIVRTWPQRGTLHAVPAEDARWLVGLSAERLVRGVKRRQAQLGLDNDILTHSKAVLTQALTGDELLTCGELLTRPKAMELLEAAGVSTQAGRGYHILWYLSQTGVTFIGPMVGKQQTIGLLDNLPYLKDVGRQEGIAELAKRYFTSHGPATVADFMWWSGLTTKDARAGLVANEELLISEVVEGTEYWLSKALAALTENTVNMSATLADSYLLPGFDEYMLGYKDRSAALHANHAPKIVPGSNGMFLSTIIIGGQVVGTWKRVLKKDHVVITLSPFTALTATQRASLQQPSEQYGRFVGLPVRLVWA